MKPTVLIVDDEPELLFLLEYVVKSLGLDVIKASSGNEAYKLLATHSIDYIISDVKMDDGDGLELLRKTKSTKPNIPFLLITGHGDIREQDVKLIGANAILPKPCSAVQLKDHLSVYFKL